MSLPSGPQFHALLHQLLSTDNATRKHAESEYQKLARAHPFFAMSAHLAFIGSPSPLQGESLPEAQLSTVLLRKLFRRKHKIGLGNQKGNQGHTNQSLTNQNTNQSPTNQNINQNGDHETANGLAVHEKEHLQSALLGLFQNEHLPHCLRKGISGCLAAWLLGEAESGAWEAPLGLVLQSIQPGTACPEGVRQNGFVVLEQIATCFVDRIVENKSLAHALCHALVGALETGTVERLPQVTNTLSHFVAVLESQDYEVLRPTLQPLLVSLNRLKAHGESGTNDFEPLAKVFDALVHMADNNMDFFAPRLGAFVEVMLHFAAMPASPNAQMIRSYAIEFLLTFCEQCPKKARGMPAFIRTFFELAMKLSFQPPENKKWEITYHDDHEGFAQNEDEEDDEDEEEASDYDLGLEAMDRMAEALKGKVLAPLATEFILQNAQSPDWRARQCALTCIGQITEGCHRAFVKNLDAILSLLLTHSRDEHPRVRYAVIASLAQIFTDFENELTSQDYQKVLPVLFSGLNDPVPRLQALSAASLCNFCDSASAEIVDECAGSILAPITRLLRSTSFPFVQQQCLATIASVAENSSQEAQLFHQFYPELMPLLFPLLVSQNVQSKSFQTLRCRAMETVALIAAAVPKEVFAKDAAGLCGYLQQQMGKYGGGAQAGGSGATGLASSSQQNEKENQKNPRLYPTDDPMFRYLLRAWICVSRNLKEDMAPYLEALLPVVLEIVETAVGLEPCGPTGEEEHHRNNENDSSLLGGNDSESENEDMPQMESEEQKEESGVQIINLCIKGVGEQKVKLRTSALEDKSLALAVVLSVVKNCGRATLPYLQQIVEKVQPLFTFGYVDDVREKAAQIAAHCVKIAHAFTNPETTVSLAMHFLSSLFAALRKETETATAAEFLEAIQLILDSTPNNFLPSEALEESKNVMQQIFAESIKRRQELFEELEEEGEEDEEAMLEEHEEEENLLIEAVDVIGKLLKTQDAFLPVFLHDFLPNFQQLLDDKLGQTEHKIALCVLDDFLEIRPETAVQCFDPILQALLRFANDTHYEVTQAACYGLSLALDLLANKKGYNPVLLPQYEINAQTSHGHGPLIPALSFICQSLLRNLTTKPDEESEEYFHSIANVATASMKYVTQFAPKLRENANVQKFESELLMGVLGVLPLSRDWQEAQFVHLELARMTWVEKHPILAPHGGKTKELLMRADPRGLCEQTKQILSSR